MPGKDLEIGLTWHISRCLLTMGYVVVFDFDWSLVNENTDTFVLEKLGGIEMIEFMTKRRKQLGSGKWTELMDDCLKCLALKGKGSREQIASTLKLVPYFDKMFAAARLAKLKNAKCYIVSDANDFYISTILREHKLVNCFDSVFTNPASFTKESTNVERLSVKPYHTGTPHGCVLCPPNMCKGAILESILKNVEDKENTQVFYVGDGSGDFCPIVRCLKSGDIVCARKGFSLNDKLKEAKVGRTVTGSDVKSKSLVDGLIVEEWSNGDDVLTVFQKYLCD